MSGLAMSSDNDPLYQDALQRARKRVQGLRAFYVSAAMYAVVIPLLWTVNLAAGGKIWAVWPTLGWGIGLTIHGLSVFTGHSIFGTAWEQRKVEQFMEEERRGRKRA